METRSGRKLSTTKLIAKSFGIIMVVLYFGLGATIIFYTTEIKSYIPLFQHTPNAYLVALGTITICYGIFRGYKVYRQEDSESEE